MFPIGKWELQQEKVGFPLPSYFSGWESSFFELAMLKIDWWFTHNPWKSEIGWKRPPCLQGKFETTDLIVAVGNHRTWPSSIGFLWLWRWWNDIRHLRATIALFTVTFIAFEILGSQLFIVKQIGWVWKNYPSRNPVKIVNHQPKQLTSSWIWHVGRKRKHHIIIYHQQS